MNTKQKTMKILLERGKLMRELLNENNHSVIEIIYKQIDACNEQLRILRGY